MKGSCQFPIFAFSFLEITHRRKDYLHGAHIPPHRPISGLSAQPPPPLSFLLPHNLALAPFHPASSATISAHRSPIASTVSIGFTLVMAGNTPASATRTPPSPRSRSPQSTTAMASRATSPIFVVPAGW